MKQLLITGASGFLGQYVCAQAVSDFTLITTSRNDLKNPLDLNNEEALRSFLDKIKVDGVIHLAANGHINYCEENREETYKLNVRATQILAIYACKLQIPFVFTSTDQVFDGTKSFYEETDQPNPLNVYAQQKLQAEQLVLENKGVVCRMPLMIGEKGGYQKTFAENLLAGKEQHLFVDEWRSVLSAEYGAKALLKALQWESGIYHLGGPKRVNRFELGIQIAQNIPQVDLSLIKKASQKDIDFLAQRPADVSLNSDRALNLGFEQA
jgi:dTDP-4-dehydrorhamnose reductase